MDAVGRRGVLAMLGSAAVAGCPGMLSSDEPDELTWTVEEGSATVTPRSTESQSDGWPMADYDAAATATAPAGHAPSSFPLEEQWSHAPHLPETPVVADGNVVVPVSGGSLVALDATSGDEQWQATRGNYAGAAPAIADGTGVVRSYPSTGPHLDAIDLTDGSSRWRVETVEGSGEKPGLVVAGRTVYDARGPTLTVRDLVTGERCTRLRLSGAAVGITGFAVADGTVYLTTREAVEDEVRPWRLVAFDPQRGVVDWTYQDAGINDVTVVDGTAYVDAGYRLQALATDTGDEVWNVDTDNYIHSTGAAADRLLVADRGGVTALATDGGEEQWRRTDVGTNAVIRAGETVFAVGATEWELHALDADDGATRWRENLIWRATGAAVAGDTLFVANDEGEVYAYA